jgi:hypothetical protein
MSGGDYTVFVVRPIAAVMLLVGLSLLLLGLRPVLTGAARWGAGLGAAPAPRGPDK